MYYMVSQHMPAQTKCPCSILWWCCRLYDTREHSLIESFVDDVMELVELEPNKDALVGSAAHSCWHKLA